MSKTGRYPIPTQVLLNDLQRVIEELGRDPILREYNDRGEYAAATYYRRFDSWKNALERARDEGESNVCDECGQVFDTKSALATHHAWKHTQNNPNSLSKMSPEDIGLSPLGERRDDA